MPGLTCLAAQAHLTQLNCACMCPPLQVDDFKNARFFLGDAYARMPLPGAAPSLHPPQAQPQPLTPPWQPQPLEPGAHFLYPPIYFFMFQLIPSYFIMKVIGPWLSPYCWF